MSNDRLDYTGARVPDDYRCCDCGAHGVKLWRIAQSFCIELRCADCARAYSHTDHGKVDDEGFCVGYWKQPNGEYHGLRSDQISPCVPAVPDEEGIGYWGYTSVPEAGVRWWRKLPTRDVSKHEAMARVVRVAREVERSEGRDLLDAVVELTDALTALDAPRSDLGPYPGVPSELRGEYP